MIRNPIFMVKKMVAFVPRLLTDYRTVINDDFHDPLPL
jgi:hypothetical protein